MSRINRAGVAQLMRSRAVTEACREPAEDLRANAKSIAPVLTGLYRATISAMPKSASYSDGFLVFSPVHYALSVEARHGTLNKAIILTATKHKMFGGG